jgi:hypothetical protein
LQALEYGAKFEREVLHMHELGVATLSALFANANRDPKKGQPAKPADFFYFQDTSKIKIPAAAANAFFLLIGDDKMPGWAVAIAPVADLQASRTGKAVALPKGWVSEEAVMLAPRVKNGAVRCPVAFIQSCGAVMMQDADDGAVHWVQIPEGEPRWMIDAEFDLIDTIDSPPI